MHRSVSPVYLAHQVFVSSPSHAYDKEISVSALLHIDPLLFYWPVNWKGKLAIPYPHYTLHEARENTMADIFWLESRQSAVG